MTHLDPDQIGTQALRCLEDVRRDRPSGPYAVHDDETVLLELESEGLVLEPEPSRNGSGHEAWLTDQGITMLGLIGVEA
ncbi:hypothetical protein [uncultured Salinicola sp.]|uniref:hypothetical protein n=1 Tax=uncultured Salinicola sp. TaxID=1193542 RepID=UPI002621EAA3|nr:hypothetical protein [uncultured Salinicola sp.]|tara:strand:+ start:1787 stop:2023 length:237 start_codon:yes stop_codon:yes gene_type:complete